MVIDALPHQLFPNWSTVLKCVSTDSKYILLLAIPRNAAFMYASVPRRYHGFELPVLGKLEFAMEMTCIVSPFSLFWPTVSRNYSNVLLYART